MSFIHIYIIDSDGRYLYTRFGDTAPTAESMLKDNEDFTLVPPPDGNHTWYWNDDHWIKKDQPIPTYAPEEIAVVDATVMGAATVRHKKITDCLDSTLSQQAFAHGLDASKILSATVSILDTDGSMIHTDDTLSVRTTVNDIIVFGGNTLMLAYKTDITILITYEDI